MTDATVEKQVNQLKIFTEGPAHMWVKDELAAQDYKGKKAKGQFTLKWFENLLSKMKKKLANENGYINDWTLNYSKKEPNQEVMAFYNTVIKQAKKLKEPNSEIKSTFI